MTKKKDPAISKSEALVLAWKSRKDYRGYEKGKGSAFNSWRSILYTEKGNHIGFPESWRDSRVFLAEVKGDWSIGKIVCRHDTALPHSNTNSYWAEKGTENTGKLVSIEYKGERKTLLEWAAELGLNYQGIRQRYFKGKNLTNDEILFGKKRKIRTPRERDLGFRTLRLLGSYKLRDKRRGLVNEMTISEFRELVSTGCVYCGDTERVGLDRIDNSLGHTGKNVVPCCYSCNCARNDNFSYEEMLEIGKTIRKIKDRRNAKSK